MTQDQAGSSTQHALQASKRPIISSGTIPPLPPRQARNVSSQLNTRSRTRSRTGSLPPLSKELNAQHHPEVPPYPHPDEDLEETPQPTPVASATPVPVDNETSKDLRHVEIVETSRFNQEPSLHPPTLGNKQNRLYETEPPVETRPAQRAVRARAPGDTRREEDEAHLRSMLDRLTTLEAVAEARDPIDSNDQLQKRILEDMRVLHQDVNTCLLYTSPSPRDLSTSRMPSSA